MKLSNASNQGQDCTCPLHGLDRKTEIRVQRFAGRLLAEGYDATATDDQMRAAFAGCVKPVSADLYPLIRAEALRVRMDEVLHANRAALRLENVPGPALPVDESGRVIQV